MKLVTVVIPCYNHEGYVVSAIESVLDQDYPQIELIVIDDGSTDDSRSKIQTLYNNRGGFEFIPQENIGLVSTLAKGINMARGEYFCQLASDDKLPVTSISRRVAYLEQHAEAVAVCTDAYRINGDIVTEQRVNSERIKKLYAATDQVETIIKGVHPIFASGLIRRLALVSCGGFDDKLFRYYEDLDTPIRLAASGRIGYIDEPLFYRREHNTNVSADRGRARLEIIRCYEKLYAMGDFYPYRKVLQYRLKRSYLALGRAILSKDGRLQEMYDLFLEKGGQYKFYHPALFYCWFRIVVIGRVLSV